MRLKQPIGIADAGISRLMAKLKKLPDDVKGPIKQAIVTSAMLITNDAKNSMRESRGGVTRTIYRDRMKVTHTASAEGEPPAVDTGQLVSSVHYELEADGMAADIGTNVLHGMWLELGELPPWVQPRPWLLPAFERGKRAHIRRTKAAINKVLKDSGK